MNAVSYLFRAWVLVFRIFNNVHGWFLHFFIDESYLSIPLLIHIYCTENYQVGNFVHTIHSYV